MKSIKTQLVFSLGAAAALLAGCGGSEPTIAAPGAMPQSIRANVALPSKPPERTVEAPDYSVSGPLLFVVNFDAPPYDAVAVYDAKATNPSPLAVIDKGLFEPNGACVDEEGTLYVGNDPGSGLGWISEYRLGHTRPLRILTKGVNIPAFCAIDAQGNLWVANAGAANVTEYLKGSVTPHRTITKGLTNPDGIAIDHAGNLYVGNLVPTGSSNVQVYAAGSKCFALRWGLTFSYKVVQHQKALEGVACSDELGKHLRGG